MNFWQWLLIFRRDVRLVLVLLLFLLVLDLPLVFFLSLSVSLSSFLGFFLIGAESISSFGTRLPLHPRFGTRASKRKPKSFWSSNARRRRTTTTTSSSSSPRMSDEYTALYVLVSVHRCVGTFVQHYVRSYVDREMWVTEQEGGESFRRLEELPMNTSQTS